MTNFKNIYKNNQQLTEEIIRVDHAGEFGAKRIYEGQIAFTKDPEQKKIIEHMKEQELEHLEFFENAIPKNKVRPTALLPLWSIFGYGLGAITAAIGPKTAMACTDAVEAVINEHYLEQIEALKSSNGNDELLKKIEKFRQDELEHQHIAIENHAKSAPMSSLVHGIIKHGCKFAIKLSKKI